MNKLLVEIKQCRVCEKFLTPNPILAFSKNSKIIIVGQAPGRIAHQTSIPWNDKSGDNLRSWLGIDKKTFYNDEQIALIPMGFCYPGTGKNGDLPPRPECAPLWHPKILSQAAKHKLIILVGQYAQNYYLQKNAKNSLTDTVKNFKTYLPNYFPLPHPSPRNNIWQAKNKWFGQLVLPELNKIISEILLEK